MEAPNLEWSSGTRVVGTYEYATDTIKVSSFLQEDIQLMEYVIYHEMLHKKYKFKSSGMKTIHHPKAFRDEEKRFKNSAELEKRLYRLCAAKRISLF